MQVRHSNGLLGIAGNLLLILAGVPPEAGKMTGILGSTALLLDRTVTVDLALRAGGAKMRVVEISDALLPLWADCSGNLAFALDWFRRHDEHELRLSVCADAFFWVHRRMTDPHIAY